MSHLFDLLLVCLSDGLMYSLLAIGYYITYTVLDFPDLTVEGTVVTGGVCYAILASAGLNPWLSMLAAFLAGCLGGCVTGLLHVKLKIRALLCGILVSTGLISINLVTSMVGTGGNFSGIGGMSTISCRNTIFPRFLPENIRKVVMFLVVVVIVKLLVDFYLKTKSGMLLIATGNNERFSSMLAKDPGNSKILGLVIGNGFAGLAGSLIVQSRQNATQTMGAGMVVIGLAAVIIGMSVFGRVKFMKPTTKVILGSVIYQLCLAVATALGVPSAYNKIIMAVLFTIALVFSRHADRRKRGAVL